jgi:hypothetical protein
VYGLLRLPTADSNPRDGKLFVDPDYSLQLSEVYWNVTARVLELNASLKMLCAIQNDSGIKLSSWVPRWYNIRTSMLAQFTAGQGPTPRQTPTRTTSWWMRAKLSAQEVFVRVS